MIPAWLLIPAVFVAGALGFGCCALFAASRVTEAEGNAEVWRHESAMWRERALGLRQEGAAK